MSNPMTSETTPNAISLLELVVGRLRSNSQVGTKTGRSGLARARASHSRLPVSSEEKLTSAISGPHGSSSSASAALVRSLASRLRPKLPLDGSMEYRLIWKPRATPQGRLICALRASGRPTSDSVCIGWPSPNAMPEGRGGLQANPEKAMERRAQGHMMNLDDAATLAGWPTPRTEHGSGPSCGVTRGHTVESLAGWPTTTVNDSRSGRNRTAERTNPESNHHDGVTLCDAVALIAGWTTPQAHDATGRSVHQKELHGTKHGCACLARDAELSGWPTTTTRDWKSARRLDSEQTRPPPLSHAVLGAITTSSPASTEKRGALAPAFPCWLLGFPPEWLSCGVSGTRSIRGSRRSSSKPTTKLSDDII